MLQYDEGNHTVNGEDALDHTIRLTQFFDHYLKRNAGAQMDDTRNSAKLKRN